MNRLLAAALFPLSLAVFGAGEPEINVVIENHKFTPDRIEIAAGQKVKLLVENRDATPEEFESASLRIEKVIPGKSKATIYVGPLKAGEYKFIGEFNEKTANGVVVAK